MFLKDPPSLILLHIILEALSILGANHTGNGKMRKANSGIGEKQGLDMHFF